MTQENNKTNIDEEPVEVPKEISNAQQLQWYDDNVEQIQQLMDEIIQMVDDKLLAGEIVKGHFVYAIVNIYEHLVKKNDH